MTGKHPFEIGPSGRHFEGTGLDLALDACAVVGYAANGGA